jgi:hypothetical protein
LLSSSSTDGSRRIWRLERSYVERGAPAEEIWDANDVIWWSPGRIRSLPEEYDHPVTDPDIAAEPATYLFFADYMIWCWAWAICCSDGPNRGRVALIGGTPDRFVADSFTGFVSKYLEDPQSVW